MKIDLEVMKVFDDGLAVKVKHVDKSLIGTGILYQESVFELKSDSCVELREDTLFVNGNYDANEVVQKYKRYDTAEERDEMYDFILKAVAEINKPKIVKRKYWIALQKNTGTMPFVYNVSNLYTSKEDLIKYTANFKSIQEIEIEEQE